MSQQLIRVLGVDPGLTRCGVGVISGAPGKPLQLVGVGVILTPSTTALELRLLQLERSSQELSKLPGRLPQLQRQRDQSQGSAPCH